MSEPRKPDEEYQVVISGGGPAGLTAGLYTSRGRLRTLLIEKGVFGGQIANAEQVDNFPGFPDGISGLELGQFMHQQADQYSLETIFAEVIGLEIQDKNKLVRTSEGDFRAQAVILASGSERRKLGVLGEEELLGRGVSYCATCDGAFFQNEVVAVVGGGNAAVSEALSLIHFASKVFIIHRRSELRATQILQERAFSEPKIEMIWDTVVDEIAGNGRVEKLRLRQVRTGKISWMGVNGVFVAIGFTPSTDYLKDMLTLDHQGHIVTNEIMETGVPGVFAAGDVRHNSAKQAITAAGDGATAALSAERYITAEMKLADGPGT
jgi:thioredoxin reductase (NADPH)